MHRRSFLQGSLGAVSLAAVAGGAQQVLADAPSIPIGSLRQAIPPAGGSVLTAQDSDFNIYQRYSGANLRTARQPVARVLLKSRDGAVAAVNWLRDNSVPFAIRGGGHCYEDFSQSDAVALDLRGLADIALAPDGATVSVGAGALLGEVYAALTAKGLLIPAGTCPQVGVAGHVMGGGYGLFSRKFGLACDSLVGAEMVDATGRVVTASLTENPDLFWALRGGGGGSFGLVTQFTFRTHKLVEASRFSVNFGKRLSLGRAAKILASWQVFAHTAPPELTVLMVASASTGAPTLNCFGLSTNTDETWIRQQLAPWTEQNGGSVGAVISRPVVDQIAHFAGAPNRLTGTITDSEFFATSYFKGKSDVVTAFSPGAAAALLAAIVDNPSVVAICDPYGGAISGMADDATAYAHRSKTLFTIQYLTQWDTGSAGARRSHLAAISAVYAAMAPYRTGGAYVNYCDLDLKRGDYGTAYWGSNLPRLRQVKAAYDAKNLFRHGQSVPL